MKLDARQVVKPWGRSELPPPFRNLCADKVGEIWFEPGNGAALPLMVKYLFTSERLSIQVHPGDAHARARGLAGGKEECWLVLDAEEGAALGIGTKRVLDSDELRAAALSGEIETLMDWKRVRPGDFFCIPAGTVHAIGAGVSLIEIQQNEDITYRLYDYGRPRELHLEDGVAVSLARPYADPRQTRVDLDGIDADGEVTLVDGPFFRVVLCGPDVPQVKGSGPLMIIPLRGTVRSDDPGSPAHAGAGECLAVEAGSPLTASPDARLLLARAS